jgi:hypothetical protein
MQKFYLRLFLLSALVAILLFVWNSYGPLNFRNNLSWYALVFFVVSTALIHYFLTQSAKQSPQVFVRSFMAITTIKLLAYLMFIVVFMMNRPPGGKVFVLHFLMLYFIYTSFETYQLFKSQVK